jgi:hypothetical protein
LGKKDIRNLLLVLPVMRTFSLIRAFRGTPPTLSFKLLE